ncbi:MAG: SUMF1/EgtB/PvdO family nonheme iron enzyme [Candidatus Riflebacteria bacterium]|nr:SUMF1/EgtB/PvdO family nonheme iron enzyme [Candidatus Riflebacteria bacterium]
MGYHPPSMSFCSSGKSTHWAAGGTLPSIAGYRVIEEAGRGGMGVVFRAIQVRTGRQVALKSLGPGGVPHPEIEARFEKEAAALRALTHPGVVRLLETVVGDQARFLVLEWIDGESLGTRIGRSRPAWSESVRIVLELLDALAFAHERGIVHRDVKPHNVLLTSDDRVKLADFGLALLKGPSAIDQARITSPGASVGSFGYAAPEQRRDAARADARSDVYSAGVLLYELLTGDLPMGRFASPSSKNAGCPAAVDGVVLQALEADPERRFASATGMRDALAAASGMAIVQRPNAPLTRSDMVRIPAGPFVMGPPGEERTVELPGYWIDRCPVTNASYRQFVEATGHPEPRYWLDAGRSDVPVGPDCPVVGVSWEDARAFAEWCGARLPTEAEWEKAARGTDARPYPWGREAEPGRCNCREAGPGRLTAVGAWLSGLSPFGLEDMLGNVLEWTASPEGPVLDTLPAGQVQTERPRRRILRGGSWFSRFEELSCWARYPELADTQMPNVGFRCARDDPPGK